MILIISQNAEHTTCFVMDWLQYKNARFRRINGMDSFYEVNYRLEPGVAAEGENSMSLPDEYDAIWFRRWLEQDYFYVNCEISRSVPINRITYEYMRNEGTVLKNYFLGKLKTPALLSNFQYVQVNKLQVLEHAKAAGLRIPRTLITSSKEELKKFLATEKKAITKNISEPTYLKFRNRFYATYTSVLDEKTLDKIPARFFPSVIQEYVEKKFEIRTFYLDGNCYSMAIFSQSNSKTRVDFRKYDYANPNRNVPYQLPGHIERSIKELMKKLNLNCGSIDLIKAVNDEFYFLEVNPLGQFGMVSEPCNYFLEEKVADWLIKKASNEKN